MISLGYTEYVTQGGDWGHVVRNPHGWTDPVRRGADQRPTLADSDDSVQIRPYARQGISHEPAHVSRPFTRAFLDLIVLYKNKQLRPSQVLPNTPGIPKMRLRFLIQLQREASTWGHEEFL